MDIDRIIKSSIKSGKIFFGLKKTLDMAKNGKAEAIIISTNCPNESKVKIQNYALLSKIHTFIYDGSSYDLGLVCGKSFPISALVVRKISDHTLLSKVKSGNPK